ncbi:flavin reductase family protein [Parasphingopyxis algicola]|uniref:flavin reductase family protein n=1 Tax=Parasphingopyxis algicola TaxID=2026624 RepID=UPI0015A37613|nr:flavin reductase family protein [Parasphingopyxis algicola]QLC26093.1 flavin reductase family protein [Parasphingopyxis algicola]
MSDAPPAVPHDLRSGSDSRTLRDALGCFGTGVTVVTTLDRDDRPVGLTANSFTSVSLDPELLLVCLNRKSTQLPWFERAEAFAVNVLHIGQREIAQRFATPDIDRFEGTDWEAWSTGVPMLGDSLANFECAKFAEYDGGDHLILLGRVIRVRFDADLDPLLYYRGSYRELHFD